MAKRDKRTVAALWLLIAPTALIIVAFIGAFVANLILSATLFHNSDGFQNGQLAPIAIIVPVTLFIIGAVGALCWLPGLIVGITLLITKKQKNAKN